MLLIPLACGPNEMDLCIVLEDANIARIKAHDPAEIVRSQMTECCGRTIRNVIVAYASPEDMKQLNTIPEGQTLGGIMEFLSRGFRFRPEEGDRDGEPYESIRPGKGRVQ